MANATIEYLYDAGGAELQKKVTTSATITVTTYIESAVYQSTSTVGGATKVDTLQFFGMEEGRVRVTEDKRFVYDYFLSDHLGNTRMVITDDYNAPSPILEAANYYPFGLKMAAISYSYGTHVKNPYQYGNGSEFNDVTGWNEFALRDYDPQTGRFVQQDPFDQFASGYVGNGNDPINNADPSGGFSLPGSVIGSAVGAALGFTYSFLKNGDGRHAGRDALIGAGFGAAIGGFGGDIGWGGGAGSNGTSAMNSKAASFASIGVHAVNIGTQLSGNFGIDNKYAQRSVDNFNAQYASYYEEDDDWKDLYKSDLTNYYKKEYPSLSTGKLQDLIGKRFEEAWNLAARRLLAGDNYQPNRFPQRGGTRTTVPDGTANGYIRHVFTGELETIPRASWFEVKAMNGNIYNSTSTGQTLGHITNLAASVSVKYRFYGPWKASAASLSFITTSDVYISPSVNQLASSYNIIIYQYKAQYKMEGRFMSVRFNLNIKNGIGISGPTTTPVILR